MKDISLSVIVPFFNAGALMHNCIKSIMSQSLKDFEIIFIDDCSTDNSVDVLNDLLLLYDRKDIIKRIIRHESNKGVACARNTGIDNANGKYIYFIDADDYIETNTLVNLFEIANDCQSDIIGCECYLSFENNERHISQPDILSPTDAFFKMTSGVMKWNLWLYLIKRSLFKENNIRFLDGVNMGEDMMVMGKLFLLASNIKIVHKPMYHYVQTIGTSMTKEYSFKHIDQVTHNIAELESFYKNISIDNMNSQIQLLKLNIKLPLIISDDIDKYELWNSWFIESNEFITHNKLLPIRTIILQLMAKKRFYFFLKLYYKVVFKFIYGKIYK